MEDIPININLYSYGFAWLAYTVLCISLTLFWRNRTLSLSLIVSIVFTAVWAAVVALGTLAEAPPIKLIQSAEAARNGSWMFLLHTIYGMLLRRTDHILAYRRWLPWYIAGITLVLFQLFAMPWVLRRLGAPPSLEENLYFILWLGFSMAVIVMVEQIYRLSSHRERQYIKYLCIALLFMYGHDFLMYAEALILRHLTPELWQSRGLVVGLTAPLIAIAVLRSKKHISDVHVSPNVVFHTFLLMAAGTYLVYISAVAYVIHIMGGTWAGVIQITFLSLSVLIFVLLVVSVRVRSWVRVWLSKNFFSYRYDYRREWLAFTDTLAASGASAPEAVIRAMANLCSSPSGLLWIRTERGRFTLANCWQMEDPGIESDLSDLGRWFEQRHWIINVEEWQQRPKIYGDLQLPEALIAVPRAWLIMPLMLTEKAEGILLLTRPDAAPELNWEDRDLLKIAGRAAATHLALYQADNALVELRQFEGFNRLSAYVVHDLKNILAQQSLIVFNAEHARTEPEFVDDVIETIRNSVDRMKRLMAQMRDGVRGLDRESVDVGAVLELVINDNNISPPPVYTVPKEQHQVEADPDQLAAVFGHLIKNAQEATGGRGHVSVAVARAADGVRVTIEDNGAGMDDDFIRHRLFKPFDTTKGLAGMGIGAYESRDYVRRLGGEIYVRSTPGVGSCFTVVLPHANQKTITTLETGVV